MTPTLVLVLTYLSLAVCAAFGVTLVHLSRVVRSIARVPASGPGRHRRHRAVVRAGAQP